MYYVYTQLFCSDASLGGLYRGGPASSSSPSPPPVSSGNGTAAAEREGEGEGGGGSGGGGARPLTACDLFVGTVRRGYNNTPGETYIPLHNLWKGKKL
jgi:hypothetical protein